MSDLADINLEPMIVTTAEKTSDVFVTRAQIFARKHGWLYVPRSGRSLARLMATYRAAGIFVFGADGLTFYREKGQMFRYAPGMALLRIKRLMKGENDLMVEIARLRSGDTFFDATAGMGGDALVASYVVGPAGRVMAIEASYLLYALVQEGLRMWGGLNRTSSFVSNHDRQNDNDERKDAHDVHDHVADRRDDAHRILSAMRRIELLHGDHTRLLARLPDRSVDTVYFDPMFDRTVKKAHGTVDMLRALGEPTPLQEEAIEQALRVARRNVMIKERPGSPLFGRYGFRVYARKASFTYGVRDVS